MLCMPIYGCAFAPIPWLKQFTKRGPHLPTDSALHSVVCIMQADLGLRQVELTPFQDIFRSFYRRLPSFHMSHYVATSVFAIALATHLQVPVDASHVSAIHPVTWFWYQSLRYHIINLRHNHFTILVIHSSAKMNKNGLKHCSLLMFRMSTPSGISDLIWLISLPRSSYR